MNSFLTRDAPGPGRSLLIAGLGNIGSEFVGHAARLHQVSHVTLIDRDVYEARNLGRQNILPADVGRPKVVVQAERLKAIQPGLVVTVHHEDLADVPLGCFRSDLIVAGLDALDPRIIVGQAAWRAGVAWLDGGVDPAAMLARVNGYAPGPSQPCFECALEERDYQQHLRNRHPCDRVGTEGVPTAGSTGLGGLVAALLAVECETFFSGRNGPSLFGRQTIIDPVHHKHYLTDYGRNPACRFDHETWCLRPLRGFSARHRLGEVFAAARGTVGFGDPTLLRVEGRSFVPRLRCPACGLTLERWHLQGRLPRQDQTCRRCAGRELLAAGFEMLETIGAGQHEPLLESSLLDLGIRDGEVLTLQHENQVQHVVIELETL